jgi:hypothetical protein
MKLKTSILLPGAAVLLFAPAFSTSALAADEDATVINLTQTACQFVESENGVDHGYTSSEKTDCEKINAETGDERLANSEVLTLKPGKYIFRVTNQNVPYSLGFWVREEDYNWANPLHKLNKISVSGGGLDTGTTLDYEVELKEGEYLYSCPLNTTPDYKLIVKS